MVAVVAAVTAAAAQPSTGRRTWAGTVPGPYAVGLTVLDGDRDTGAHAISRALVWRPIQAARDPITFEMFAHAVCPPAIARTPTALVVECFPNLASGLKGDRQDVDAAAVARVASERLHAGFGGAPLPSRRAVVVIAGALSGTGGEFISLAETLASHGFLVAAVAAAAPAGPRTRTLAEAERTQLAIAQMLSRLSDDAGADTSRVALAAWSFGGVPIVLEAFANPRVQALVSLDSAMRYEYGSDLIRAAPGYAPARFRGRVLHVTAGVDNTVAKDDRVLEALGQARVERHVADGLSHADFSDHYGALPALARPAAERARFHQHYNTMVARVVAFLKDQAFPPPGQPFSSHVAFVPR